MKYWDDLSPKHQQTIEDLVTLASKYNMEREDFLTILHAIFAILDIPLKSQSKKEEKKKLTFP